MDPITLLIATGLRRSELLGLRREDYNDETGLLTVTGKVIRVKGEAIFRVDETKSVAGRRTIPLPQFAITMLRRRRELPYFGEQAVIFPSIAGTLGDPNNFAAEWRTVREQLGVPDATTHSFRKTLATLIDDEGLSARIGADHLGHSHVSMTQERNMSRGRIHSQWPTSWTERCAQATTRINWILASLVRISYPLEVRNAYSGVRTTQARSTPLPTALTRAPMKTIRPADAVPTYAHPRPQLARLTERGLLHRLADGYYAVVPQEMVGHGWMPGLETAAAGIASAIYGPDDIVVMGVSAARLYGAIPRALATATVAVPAQHRPIALSDRAAVVRFIKRNTQGIDAERYNTELGPTLVTTPEQTILDLAHRPKLGDAEIDIPAAVAALYERSDKERLQALATEQRRVASLRRATSW